MLSVVLPNSLEMGFLRDKFGNLMWIYKIFLGEKLRHHLAHQIPFLSPLLSALL